ncbi:MAG TPA: hypothetical protein VL137_01000 [Polyangiaceae bacterium]|nr:hypothetical protein [Polyangiaceae bacterium]
MGVGAKVGLTVVGAALLAACSSNPNSASSNHANGGRNVVANGGGNTVLNNAGNAGSDGRGGGSGAGGAQSVSPSLPSEPWLSGNRLRARVITDGNGASLFEGWHDEQLNLDCSFRFADDDKLHCLPIQWTAAQAVYSDGACTQRVAMVAKGEPAQPFIQDLEIPQGFTPSADSARCTLPGPSTIKEHALRPGNPLARGPVFALVDGQCQPLDESTFPATAYDEVSVNAVEASTFVAADLKMEAAAGGVRAIWCEGEDGSIEVRSLIDTNDQECDAVDIGGASRCVTVHSLHVGPADGFADAACSVPLLQLVNLSGCADSTVVTLDAQFIDTCADPVDPSFYPAESLDQMYDFAPADQAGNMGCFPSAGGQGFYAQANAVDPARFPAVTWIEQGGDRLRARFGLSASGVPSRNPDDVRTGLAQIQFYDTALGRPCIRGQTTDGDRCLPEVAPSFRPVTQFIDAACSQLALTVNPNGCLPSTSTIVIEPDAVGSLIAQSFVQVTGTALVDTFYTLTDPGKAGPNGPCVLETGLMDQGFHAVAAERHPITELVALSETVE